MPESAAVFLDRDGTLIEDVGILRHPDQIRLFPDTIEALSLLAKRFELFVITNQPGISTGQITSREVAGVNLALDDLFKKKGIYIRKWFVCPHTRNDHCRCMKPKPFFIRQAAEKYNLDLTGSFCIGDHPDDVLTGNALGVFGVYVLTGHGIRHLGELPEDRPVFHSLTQAAAWIEEHPLAMDDLDRAISHASAMIKSGGLVAFPTETVYGLGADAFNPLAVARIFEAKRRPLQNPLIVHISDPAQLDLLVSDISPTARKLMDRFWPGPLSLVFPKKDLVLDIVTAGHSSVAVRMPAHPLATELIRRSGTPIAAPSANAFGRTSATSAAHVLDQLRNVCDILIDGGACRIGLESTVVSLVSHTPALLRPGAIGMDELELATGIRFMNETTAPHSSGLKSPGMMTSHYQTETPLNITDDFSPFYDRDDVGFLVFGSDAPRFPGPVRNLSPAGDLREAAANLYKTMRELDGLGLCKIVARLLPEEGLGHAINDRLRKAACKLNGSIGYEE